MKDHAAFTVAIDWVRGQDPEIIIRKAGRSQEDREAIAYALRLAADMVEAEDAEIVTLS